MRVTKEVNGNIEIISDVTFRQYHMTIFAQQMSESFEVETLDAIEFGQAGDWFIRSPEGQYFIVSADRFEKWFELV